jgi:hypothetical protein
MIFSIQRFLEDYFEGRSLRDVDQFAVSIANLYDNRRAQTSDTEFLRAMRRLRTVFYKNNSSLTRVDFERHLLKLLDDRFDPKKKGIDTEPKFTGNLSHARRRVSALPRITINRLLSEYKSAIESRGIDAFWESRKRNELRSKPEKIAQSLLATALKMLFHQRNSGLVLREFGSGVGFVDVGVVLSNVLHVVELKVLVKKFQGPAQLLQYMKQEHRSEGWLIVVDSRPANLKTPIPNVIPTKQGPIRILTIDINPLAPSTLKAI